MEIAMATILVVDDEPSIRTLLSGYLSSRGYRVRLAAEGLDALALVDQESPDLIVLDIHMPGLNGIEVLKRLRAKNYTGGVILLTGSPDERVLQEGLDLGAIEILGKPWDRNRLELAVQSGCIRSAP
jgi:CheY-like chemotaxis protein